MDKINLYGLLAIIFIGSSALDEFFIAIVNRSPITYKREVTKVLLKVSLYIYIYVICYVCVNFK